MRNELSNNWIDALLSRLPLSHSVSALLFGGLIFIIYLGFMYRDLDSYTFSESLFFSTLIIYLLIGNRYIVDRLDSFFSKIEFLPGKEELNNKLYNQFRENFYNLKIYYVVIVTVMLPPIIIDILQWDFNNPADFYIFDIYNYIVFLLGVYLLINTLWIIINVSVILKNIGKSPYINFIKLDLFNYDKIGGLGSLRNIVFKLILYYSIGICLAVLSYINPNGIRSLEYDIVFFISLLSGGVFILVAGLGHLQYLFRRKMIEDIDSVNSEYKIQYQKLNDSISKAGSDGKVDMESALKLMDALHKERAEREEILSENRMNYSITALIVGSISIILPVLTLIEKLNNYGLATMALNASLNITGIK